MDSFRDFAHSKPVLFLVGPEKAPIYIHSALLKHYSERLTVLTESEVKDEEEEGIVLESPDRDTFVRFMEFIYTGDYPAAKPSFHTESIAWGSLTPLPNGEVANDERQPVEEEIKFDVVQPVQHDHKHQPPTYSRPLDGMWMEFVTLRSRNSVVNHTSVKVLRNGDPRERYADVFLSHAKLYVFAQTWDIEKLGVIALDKLHEALCNFTLFEDRVEDIVQLVAYTYVDQNTKIRKCNKSGKGAKSKKNDKLRALVMDYVSCHAKMMMQNKDFSNLLAERNYIAPDLVQRLLDNLT